MRPTFMRKYGRDDVEYESFYSNWMKDLAKRHTKEQLENLYGTTANQAAKDASSHLRAIESSTSMTSQSARRAHTRNVVAASSDYKYALSGAIEIHELFPEFAHENA